MHPVVCPIFGEELHPRSQHGHFLPILHRGIHWEKCRFYRFKSKGRYQRIRPLRRHERIELDQCTRSEIRPNFREICGRTAASKVLLDYGIQPRMPDDLHIRVSFRDDAGAQSGMRMAINDRFHRLLAESTNGLMHELAIVLAISGIEGDESLVGIDNGHGRDSIAAEHPHSFGRVLDRRLEPDDLLNTVKELLVGDRAIGSFAQGDRRAHVGARLSGAGRACVHRSDKHQASECFHGRLSAFVFKLTRD